MMTKDEYIRKIEGIIERVYAWTPPRWLCNLRQSNARGQMQNLQSVPAAGLHRTGERLRTLRTLRGRCAVLRRLYEQETDGI